MKQIVMENHSILEVSLKNKKLFMFLLFLCFLCSFLVDILKGRLGNICQVDCSNRGICDYLTGQCKCFEGSWGEACQSLSNTGVHVLHAGSGAGSFALSNGNSSILVVGN
jgi:hypothetical protein